MTPQNASEAILDLAAIRQALHATGVLLADLAWTLAEVVQAEGKATKKRPARKRRRKAPSKAS